MEHRISSPYHPQTNGLDERINQTLVRMLKKLVTTEEDWDQYIDTALYAYRISIQDSSRFSPFFLIYNRHPRKIIDFELSTADDLTPAKSIKISDEILEKNMDKLERNITRRLTPIFKHRSGRNFIIMPSMTLTMYVSL